MSYIKFVPLSLSSVPLGVKVMMPPSFCISKAFDMQNDGGIITLTPSGTEDRERGTNLMYDMMSLFESQGAVQ